MDLDGTLSICTPVLFMLKVTASLFSPAFDWSVFLSRIWHPFPNWLGVFHSEIVYSLIDNYVKKKPIPPKTGSFQIKILIFFIFLLKT